MNCDNLSILIIRQPQLHIAEGQRRMSGQDFEFTTFQSRNKMFAVLIQDIWEFHKLLQFLFSRYFSDNHTIIFFVFLTFPFKMSGIVAGDYKQYASIITSIRDKYSANQICLYSTNTISKGFQESLNVQLGAIKVTYVGRDELINLIDKSFPEYWRHDDRSLVKYEIHTDLFRFGG